MLIEIWSNGFKFPCIKVPGYLECCLWVSIFLFAYGGIQLILCGLSASLCLWWYVKQLRKIQMKTL